MIQRIPKEKKEAYNLVVKEYKERLEATNNKAKKFEREGMANNNLAGYYKRIAAANVYFNTVGLYCEMNDKSVEIMNMKNDAYLTNARKNIYQAIKLIETIVGSQVDSSLTDNEEILSRMKLLNPRRILNLMKKIEYTIALVEFEEGENSKWKWNFVELYGKFAAICKNLTNFKGYAAKLNNPMVEYYEEINEILRIVKRSTDTAAQKYRMKYELGSMDVTDMSKSIDYMNMLVRIYIILNEVQQAQDAKKTIEKWKEKLEQDLKKKEESQKAEKKKEQKRRF